MFSMFKRIGAKSCKVQLNIDLKELKFFNERDDITLVCIELKRGSKSISSSSKVCSERESLIVKFDDQLALFMTLYKDSNGKYIEKRGNLVLNGHSKITNSTIVLGSVDLKLNLLASDFVAQKLDSVFVDSTGATVASLSAIATSRFIGDGIADDDESSNMSEVSSKSYLQTTDVRYGSVYRDNSGIIDPDVSTETTEKFRNKILQRKSCATPDQGDGGTLSDGYEISEISFKRKNKGNISKQVGFSPRVKHSLAFGPKGEEIADLYRELEQANRRAATAQQEQRNISAVIAADTRKHEVSVHELRMKINLMQSEIEGLTPASNTAQRGELDRICSDVQSLDTVSSPAGEGKGESSDEDPEELRSLVESLRRKLKDSMSNEMTTSSELTRLQAILIASSKKRETECAEMAVRMAAVEVISVAAVEAEAEAAAVSRMGSGLTILMGSETTDSVNDNCIYKNEDANTASLHAEIAALTDDLTEAHRSLEVFVAVVSSGDAELAELKEDRNKVAAELTEILSQNEKLTSVCGELRRTISEREKKSDRRTPNSTGAAAAESEVIADLQIQLAIKRVSENSLLLREMQELQEEVNGLQQEKSLNNDLAASLKIAGEKYTELAATKMIVESSLEASNRTVVSLAGDIEVLRALVTDLYRKVSPDESVEITDLRRRMTDAKINFNSETDNEDPDRRFQSNLESWYGDLRVPSRPTSVDLAPDDSIAELDIEKLILESEEELVRVKEKRVGFKQSKLLKRGCTDKVLEKSASAGRKREIAALLAQNCELEDKLFKSESERLLLTSEARASVRPGNAENEKETDRLTGDRSYDSPLPASPRERDALYVRGDFVASPADPDPDPDPADSTCSSADHYHDHDQYEEHDGEQDSLLAERIFSLENSAEVEKRKFEGRIQILLKASGMYDSTYSNFIAGTDQSDERWKEVVRAQSDIERKKVMTLKTCLMRFSSKLTADEVDELEDYGVVLAPRLSSRTRNRGLNLGSALCFI